MGHKPAGTHCHDEEGCQHRRVEYQPEGNGATEPIGASITCSQCIYNTCVGPTTREERGHGTPTYHDGVQGPISLL